jgi:hypothetical protein
LICILGVWRGLGKVRRFIVVLEGLELTLYDFEN